MYNRGLFAPWVPKPVMLLLIILLLLVIMFINPIYVGNISQMVSSTGIISEYFMWANFALPIGMALLLPMLMRVKMRFRSKELMITTMLTMAILSVVIATTSSSFVVVGASLIFGFMKMIAMIEIVLPVMFILSPTGEKRRFYSLFYPIVLILGQLGGYWASYFALPLGWQMLHFYSAATLLLTALICVIFMHNQRFSRKLPLYRIDWLGILLFGVCLMSMAYVFTFGKQQDWFVSPHIKYATVLSVISGILLVYYELNTKRPYILFRHYGNTNIVMGLVLLIGQGMYMGASSLMSVYTNAILGYNWIINASLNLMMMPGIVIAGFVAFHWTKNGIPIKMYIFTGFAAYFLYTVMLYFIMVPDLNFESLFIPQILNGYGMCALFISIWIYLFEKVPANKVLPSVAPIMIFRSFVVISFFTCLFGWLQYKFQWQSISDHAVYFDTLVLSNSSNTYSIKGVQLGAVLAANKKLLGYIILAGLGFLTFIFCFQFGVLKYRIVQHKKWKEAKRPRSLPDKIGDIAGSIP